MVRLYAAARSIGRSSILDRTSSDAALVWGTMTVPDLSKPGCRFAKCRKKKGEEVVGGCVWKRDVEAAHRGDAGCVAADNETKTVLPPAAWTQCSIFTGIGPEAESNPVILRIKYGIISKKKEWYLSQSGCGIKSGINTTTSMCFSGTQLWLNCGSFAPRIHHASSS